MRFNRFNRRKAGPALEISEKAGIRSLHLNSETVQSSMSLTDPDRLVLAYTRAMMSYLLFKPQARDIWMIGLGGGSIPKFIHRHLPQSRCRVLELHESVVGMARSLFQLPPDDERLTVIVADGADYVQSHPAGCDVLMVDGFDGFQIAPELATPAFFANCAHALRDDGIFAMNLWGSDKAFRRHCDAIAEAFDGRLLLLPVREKGNVVALAFKAPQGNPKWDALRERAKPLQAALNLELLDFVADLASMNLSSDKRLMI